MIDKYERLFLTVRKNQFGKQWSKESFNEFVKEKNLSDQEIFNLKKDIVSSILQEREPKGYDQDFFEQLGYERNGEAKQKAIFELSYESNIIMKRFSSHYFEKPQFSFFTVFLSGNPIPEGKEKLTLKEGLKNKDFIFDLFALIYGKSEMKFQRTSNKFDLDFYDKRIIKDVTKLKKKEFSQRIVNLVDQVPGKESILVYLRTENDI